MPAHRHLFHVSGFALATFTICLVHADDWPQFRGPGGLGIAEITSAAKLPSQWSPEANLAWSTALPGAGVSSPIIVNQKVFVTCYSGYGLDQANPGEIENLMRHLVCVELATGKILWQRDIKASLPEDPFTGVGVTAHGYASHTPVSDGKNVYVFFGKSGVYAFDFDGEQVWHAEVGKESDPTEWGSSSSPVLYDNTVIVTASAESQAIIGLDKTTGAELWRQEASGLDGMWGTPTLVDVQQGRTDLVMCVAKEMWGLDPSSGKLRWYAEATGAEQAYSSLVTDGNKVFAFTGRGGGSVAIKVGESGDISDSNTLWTGTETSSFGSPVRHESKLYVASRGVVTIVDAETGAKIDQVRLEGAERSGGRFGSLDYASPIVVGDRMFYLNGSGQMFVLDLNENAKQIAVNKVSANKESFGGSPAVSDGRLVIRSDKAIYCVTDQGETLAPEDQFDPAKLASSEPSSEPSGREGRDSTNRGGPGQNGGDNAGGGRFDPMSIFNGRDANQDGKLTQDEIAGGPMADRFKELDKDGDQAISAEEFRTSMSNGYGGDRRGGGRPGRDGSGGQRPDTRPERPQRPVMAN